jgi:hypothetical protein
MLPWGESFEATTALAGPIRNARLTASMRFQAEVNLGSRTVMEYLFSPV